MLNYGATCFTKPITRVPLWAAFPLSFIYLCAHTLVPLQLHYYRDSLIYLCKFDLISVHIRKRFLKSLFTFAVFIYINRVTLVYKHLFWVFSRQCSYSSPAIHKYVRVCVNVACLATLELSQPPKWEKRVNYLNEININSKSTYAVIPQAHWGHREWLAKMCMFDRWKNSF